MMSCAIASFGLAEEIYAVPYGGLCGVAIGVADLRIRVMIVTLAANGVAHGLIVLDSGGFSPRDFASPEMRRLARLCDCRSAERRHRLHGAALRARAANQGLEGA
jgi:ribose transport system permease protein